MSGAEALARIRAFLDDPDQDTTDYKSGEYWSDAIILLALNNSQLAIVAFLAKKRQTYLISGLLASTSSTTVPSNYLFSLSGECQEVGSSLKQAELMVGWSARDFTFSRHRFTVGVLGNTIEYRTGGVVADDGVLWYIRQPTVFTDVSTNEEMDDRVYDAIIAHATLALMSKDTLNSRFTKLLQEKMKTLMTEPSSQFPGGLREAIVP